MDPCTYSISSDSRSVMLSGICVSPLWAGRWVRSGCCPRRRSFPGNGVRSNHEFSVACRPEACGKTCTAPLACTEREKHKGLKCKRVRSVLVRWKHHLKPSRFFRSKQWAMKCFCVCRCFKWTFLIRAWFSESFLDKFCVCTPIVPAVSRWCVLYDCRLPVCQFSWWNHYGDVSSWHLLSVTFHLLPTINFTDVCSLYLHRPPTTYRHRTLKFEKNLFILNHWSALNLDSSYFYL